jgi:release factor glutamine methyltransferase
VVAERLGRRDDRGVTTASTATLDFGPLTIEYDDRVLRPRPWVQLQSRWAAELLDDGAVPGPVLELCSGAGHIGLLVAELTGRRLVAVDLNPAACHFTRTNARRAGLEDLVEVREGRLEDAVGSDEQFVLVVADPPWVTSAEVGRFPEDPLLAIDGGVDGLAVARACLEAVAGHVAPGGSVLLQLGDDAQADAVLAWASARGWSDGGRRAGERGLVLRLVP